MSSTNRSNSRDSHVSDYYITPMDEINKFLTHLEKVYKLHLYNGRILEPCAGGDERNPMSYVEALKVYNNKIDTIDIREDSKAELKADYLNTDCKGKYDLIITNPPFVNSLEIITKALDDVKPDGIVVMLEKINFFGSDKRKSFWDKNMPELCFLHSKRMSFTGDRKTDSIEYCHMVWRKGLNPEFTSLKVI